MLMPFTVGFWGKSYLAQAAQEGSYHTVYILFTASAVGMFLVLIKLFWCIFFGEKPASKPIIKELPAAMTTAMILMTLLCIIPAVPGISSFLLAHVIEIMPEQLPYHAKAVLAQCELAGFTLLAFFMIKHLLTNTTSIQLDFDWFYRILLNRMIYSLRQWCICYCQRITLESRNVLAQLIRKAYILHGPKGIFARSWNLSTTVLWSVLLLGIYMALYYSF
jgi:hypothetical protein